MLKESKDNILVKCTLVNYLNKKYDLNNGLEIVSSKEYNKIAKEHKAKGSLVLIGSEMCYHVYPDEIIKRKAVAFNDNIKSRSKQIELLK